MTTISVETKYIASVDSALPALALQVTRLVDSYMIWIGTTQESPEEVHKAPLHGCLANDWACAMPLSAIATQMPASATSLFRTSGSEAALSMAQRLARRFRKQIFLSVDVPPNYQSMGQGPNLLLEMEKGIMGVLKVMEDVPAS